MTLRGRNFEPDDGFMVGAALGASFNEWLRGEVEVSGHFHDVSGDAYVYLNNNGNTYV